MIKLEVTYSRFWMQESLKDPTNPLHQTQYFQGKVITYLYFVQISEC